MARMAVGLSSGASPLTSVSVLSIVLSVILALASPARATTPAAAPAEKSATGISEISGSVSFPGSGPAAGVLVDLFVSLPASWNRGDYLSSTTADADGRFRFTVDDGCYIVVMVAPVPATFHAGSPYWQQPVCVEDGRAQRSLDAVLASAPPGVSRLVGQVTHRDRAGAGGVLVEVFRADGVGSRGLRLSSLYTAGDGRFSLDVTAGCYALSLAAPAGDRFTGGGAYRTVPLCVPAGGSADAEAVLESISAHPPELSPVELEIVRLTNALRIDPSGSLARNKPMPTCITERFYGIGIDLVTGHPEPVAPLAVDAAASAVISRAWARDMARSGDFEHRTSASQQLLYSKLERQVAAWGENIAWFSGYDPARTARIHFEGWRESDTGHYCSMMTSRFTHLGVGELYHDGESWAVQNFYG